MEDTSPTRRGLGRRLLLATALSAAAPTGCQTFEGTTAASFLIKIRQDPDPNKRFYAYQNLASPRCYDSEQQKGEAIAILIAKFEEGREPMATKAVICRTLGELRDPRARETLIKAVSHDEGIIRVQACRGLGKVGRPEDATILCRVMTVDTLEDCRIAAIEGLGELKSPDPRIKEVLINGMEHDDPAIRLASLDALRKITGKDLGVDASGWRKELETQARARAAAAATATLPAAVPAVSATKPPAVTLPVPTGTAR